MAALHGSRLDRFLGVLADVRPALILGQGSAELNNYISVGRVVLLRKRLARLAS